MTAESDPAGAVGQLAVAVLGLVIAGVEQRVHPSRVRRDGPGRVDWRPDGIHGPVMQPQVAAEVPLVGLAADLRAVARELRLRGQGEVGDLVP